MVAKCGTIRPPGHTNSINPLSGHPNNIRLQLQDVIALKLVRRIVGQWKSPTWCSANLAKNMDKHVTRVPFSMSSLKKNAMEAAQLCCNYGHKNCNL